VKPAGAIGASPSFQPITLLKFLFDLVENGAGRLLILVISLVSSFCCLFCWGEAHAFK